jgi:hypothetical protein
VSVKEFTIAIVGIDYPNEDRAKTNRRSELLLLPIGAVLALVPEPKNPHDRWAVAAFSPSGIQVGYVTAERAQWIGGKIREGIEVNAIYQGVFGSAGYARVRVGDGMPTLPPVAFAPGFGDERDPADGDGFWPDDDGPEWGA